jgi:hypothetical protein
MWDLIHRDEASVMRRYVQRFNRYSGLPVEENHEKGVARRGRLLSLSCFIAIKRTSGFASAPSPRLLNIGCSELRAS